MGVPTRSVLAVALLAGCSAFPVNPRRGGRRSLQQRSAAGEWEEVPVQGNRIAKIRKEDVAELEDLRERIGHVVRTERTNVVVLPSPEQGQKQFDATIAALNILGISGMVNNIPQRAWHATASRLQEIMQAIKRDHPGLPDFMLPRMMDQNMISRALSPLFDELLEASNTADLPACDRLILVGCDDGAWVLHALLNELRRQGVAPREHLTVVALGASTNTKLAKAVTAVYPGRAETSHAETSHGASGRINYISLCGASVGDAEVCEVEDSEVAESLPCLATQENSEECILSTSCLEGSTEHWHAERILSTSCLEGSTEHWHAEPKTVAKWISRCF